MATNDLQIILSGVPAELQTAFNALVREVVDLRRENTEIRALIKRPDVGLLAKVGGANIAAATGTNPIVPTPADVVVWRFNGTNITPQETRKVWHAGPKLVTAARFIQLKKIENHLFIDTEYCP